MSFKKVITYSINYDYSVEFTNSKKGYNVIGFNYRGVIRDDGEHRLFEASRL